uniref:BTB domain-containing protein n=1 Tax=Globodera rostochiensis TaxID=31243 RepID=A0A914H0Q1_GLORO
MPKPNSLVGRIKHLLSTGDDADIQFLVGGGDKKEILSAHKLILKTASDVFETMFRFDARNAKADAAGREIKPVEVPDVEVGAFKAMLSFIYADDLSGLNGDNAMAVLYAAKKYDVAGLTKACVAVAIPKLRNVFVAFDQARLLEEKDFSRRCLAYIDKNADTLLLSKLFLQIEQKLLCEILGRDELMTSKEITIWNAALRWADEKCRQNSKKCSAENRRAMLGPALFKIRFSLIPQKDFSEKIVPSGLLTDAELVGVYLHYSHPDVTLPGLYPRQFPTKQQLPAKSLNDDPYKANGKIMLKIEKVSKFARQDENSRQLSEAVYIRGRPLKILAQPSRKGKGKYLGFFLQCSTESNWSCACSATLRIVSQKAGKKDFTQEISHIFHSKASDWGFEQFMPFQQLMGSKNGWYDAKNDTVILEADVTAYKSLGEK